MDHPVPGITRRTRLSDEGLARLEKQLATGARISLPVLQQWVRRYSEDARALLRRHGYDID